MKLTTNRNVSFFWTLFLFVTSGSLAQNLKLTLGPGQIGSNEVYTITLTALNQNLDEYSNFPNIEGFAKAGTSSSSSTRVVNGSMSSETSIIQNYMPTKEGVFKLAPFSMKANGSVVKSPGATIKVGPPVEARRGNDPFGDPFAYDPFEDFFGGAKRSDLKDVKADAFLSVQTDKKEIWTGEGVNVTMSFVVAEDNPAELDFYDLANQMAQLTRKLKPANCWEENFGIEEVTPRRLTIGKKHYTEYRLYQATLFPLVARSFTIPAVTLNMINYKVGSAANFFGAPRKQEIKGFSSKPIPITVKELPPHPLKGNVSVGSFTMVENLARKRVAINEGVSLDLTIKGEGNITYIAEPQNIKNDFVDQYPPNTRQTIQRAGGRITGEKTFSYLLVPKERGTITLKKMFNWVYFNTKTGRYDSLRPQGQFVVVEGKKMNSAASATSQNAFYSKIDKADKDLIGEKADKSSWLLWVNISMGLMAATTLWLSLKKR